MFSFYFRVLSWRGRSCHNSRSNHRSSNLTLVVFWVVLTSAPPGRKLKYSGPTPIFALVQGPTANRTWTKGSTAQVAVNWRLETGVFYLPSIWQNEILLGHRWVGGVPTLREQWCLIGRSHAVTNNCRTDARPLKLLWIAPYNCLSSFILMVLLSNGDSDRSAHRDWRQDLTQVEQQPTLVFDYGRALYPKRARTTCCSLWLV